MNIKLLIIALLLFGNVNAQSPTALWSTAAGGINSDDGNSITTDQNGNVYVTGYFQSPSITFGATTIINTGSFDAFVVKYNANGNVLWAKGAGGTADDVGNSITSDPNGNVYITGYFYSQSITFGTTTLTNNSPGNNDIFVVKYDASGNVLWAKKEGGTYYDLGKSISTDANGNVFVTGNFSSSSILFGTDNLTNTSMFGWDTFVVKYDTNGNVLWAKGAAGSGGEYANSVSTDANGNAIITGNFYSPSITFGTATITNSGMPNIDSDIFIVKYDASGNVLWAKGAGGPNHDVAKSISTDANGNVFVTGNFKGPSLSIGTTSLTNTNVDNYDVFAVKYDANGNVLWAKGAAGAGNEFANSISTDANGNVFVTGSFYSPTLSFGTTTLTNTNTSANTSDIFIVKYDAAGNVLWEKQEGGTNNDVGFGITPDANGNVFLTGNFQSDSITFGTTTTLTNQGGSVFTVKLGNTTAGIEDLSYNSPIKLFPNPCSSSTTLEVSEYLTDATLIVYDSFGQTVKEIKNISGQTVVLSLKKLANGTYFVRLMAENKTYTDKLVIFNK